MVFEKRSSSAGAGTRSHGRRTPLFSGEREKLLAGTPHPVQHQYNYATRVLAPGLREPVWPVSRGARSRRKVAIASVDLGRDGREAIASKLEHCDTEAFRKMPRSRNFFGSVIGAPWPRLALRSSSVGPAARRNGSIGAGAIKTPYEEPTSLRLVL